MPLIAQAARAARNAFFSPGFRIFGLPFARDYLRIARYAANHWGSTAPGEMQMLGYRVPYPNHSHALLLVHEVFVNASYAFSRRPRPRIVDCGANIGMSVVFFKAYAPDARITAIEAEPGTFKHLQRTIETNAFADVELVHAAVGATQGPVTLYAHASNSGDVTASVHAQWGGSIAEHVPGIRLSSLIQEPIDFLKVDIEGAEYDVIADLADARVLPLVREMLIECHSIEGAPDARSELIGRLRDSGMEVRVAGDNAAARTSIVHGTLRRSGVHS
jgi:FkbM family methyltransferase